MKEAIQINGIPFYAGDLYLTMNDRVVKLVRADKGRVVWQRHPGGSQYTTNFNRWREMVG